MREIAPGVGLGVTAPVTYRMNYANGQQTYTEPFVLLRFDARYVAAAGAAIGPAIHAAAAQLAAIPFVGPALGGLLELAVGWYSSASLDGDGSVTLQLAQHYCGTKAGGIDLTAWPAPGVDPGGWQNVLNGFRRAASLRLSQADVEAGREWSGGGAQAADAVETDEIAEPVQQGPAMGVPAGGAGAPGLADSTPEERLEEMIRAMSTSELDAQLTYLCSLPSLLHSQELAKHYVKTELGRRGRLVFAC